MIHCGASYYPFFPAYTGNACTPESRRHKNKGRLRASPKSKFRVPSEPFLYPSNIQVPSQVRTSKKMGHRSSRSTLPSNYIHLWDYNRGIDVSTIKGNIWSIQDKHWQLGIFSSTRKTSPSDSEPLTLENDWSFNQSPLAILVNEFLIRVMQYFLEHSMGLVQPISWIRMYYIRFMSLFFAHSTLVAVQYRPWFCWARSLSIYESHMA